MDSGALLAAFLTTLGTIFVTELTDKDAIFLLALATKTRPSLVFAAGVIAFTVSTLVIVAVGSLLISVVPVVVIKLAGGAIMLAYAALEFSRFSKEQSVSQREEKLLGRQGASAWSIFLPAVATLVLLDLAGDATELVTVVLLARFQDALVVLAGALAALYAAVAVETALGNRLGRILSPKRIRALSVVVFLAIGTIVVITSLFGA